MTRDVTVTFEDDSQHVYRNVPDEVTPDSIESRATKEFGKTLKSIDGGRFAQTPGGAATGNPRIQAQGSSAERVNSPATGSMIGAAQSIAGATGGGAVAGFFAPELLTTIGGALKTAPYPIAQTAGSALMGAGAATRGARGLSAATGAVSGATGETAGQTVELAGGPQWIAEGARILASGGGPLLAQGLTHLANRVWHSQVWRTAKEASDAMADAVAKAMGKKPEDIPAQLRKRIDDEIELARGGQKSDAPMRDVYGGLESGAQRVRVLAQEEADNLLSAAERQARQEYDDALTGPVHDIATKRARLNKLNEEVIARARNQRGAIGQDRDLTDIGGELRGVVVARNEAALEARSAQYKADQAARDAVVKAKEQNGIVVEDLPEYKKMLESLQSKLLNSKTAREAAKGMAEVTDSGMLTGYQRIYDAVSRRRVQTGVDDLGNPTYQEFKTSFEALDHVRRKLGDVFRGKEAEGYSALGADTARHYYAQISEIQRKFGGDAQERLLKQYADSTAGLEMFGSKTGKKLTAVDKLDIDFLTDPSKLPTDLLKTKSGIEALKTLTGDNALVTRAALDYTTNQLGKMNSEQQVRRWMSGSGRELMSISEVRTAVSNYADTLARAERNVSRIEKYQKILSQRESSTMSAAERAAAETRAAGEMEAGQVLKFGDELSNRIVGDTAAVARVRELIESGKRSQWEAAAPAILDDPKAKAATFDAVRQVVADRASKSPKGISEWYAEKVQPFIVDSGLVTPQQSQLLSTRLQNIENMKIPEQEKISRKMQFLLQAMAGYSASLAARASPKYVPD